MPEPDGNPADFTKKVKVFIPLGQSNMVGASRIDAGDKGKPEGSLEHAVGDAATRFPITRETRAISRLPGLWR